MKRERETGRERIKAFNGSFNFEIKLNPTKVLTFINRLNTGKGKILRFISINSIP